MPTLLSAGPVAYASIDFAKVDRLAKSVPNTVFDRQIQSGFALHYSTDGVAGGFIYDDDEKRELAALDGEKRVESRMPVRVTKWYLDRALRSRFLMQLVKATPEETRDLSGSPKQGAGIVHLYPEIVRFAVSRTCSCACRYCHQQDFLSRSKQKSIATAEQAMEYVLKANQDAGGDLDPALGPCSKVTEALLSGGDPLMLSNNALLRYLALLAEAGIPTIRIGTKELAFYPFRFDSAFFHAMDAFHAAYSQVRLFFMLQFTHPDEFLQDIPSCERTRCSEWTSEVATVIRNFHSRREFISLENQTPIVRGVNDSVATLSRLQIEMCRHGIENHYFFQCQDMVGHKSFAVPVEQAYSLFRESQRGLSGVASHARFVLSTSIGKLEVVGLAEHTAVSSHCPESTVVFRVIRAPRTNPQSAGALITAKRNPAALWITDYLDRILFDGTDSIMRVGAEAP